MCCATSDQEELAVHRLRLRSRVVIPHLWHDQLASHRCYAGERSWAAAGPSTRAPRSYLACGGSSRHIAHAPVIATRRPEHASLRGRQQGRDPVPGRDRVQATARHASEIWTRAQTRPRGPRRRDRVEVLERASTGRRREDRPDRRKQADGPGRRAGRRTHPPPSAPGPIGRRAPAARATSSSP